MLKHVHIITVWQFLAQHGKYSVPGAQEERRMGYCVWQGDSSRRSQETRTFYCQERQRVSNNSVGNQSILDVLDRGSRRPRGCVETVERSISQEVVGQPFATEAEVAFSEIERWPKHGRRMVEVFNEVSIVSDAVQNEDRVVVEQFKGNNR